MPYGPDAALCPQLRQVPTPATRPRTYRICTPRPLLSRFPGPIPRGVRGAPGYLSATCLEFYDFLR